MQWTLSVSFVLLEQNTTDTIIYDEQKYSREMLMVLEIEMSRTQGASEKGFFAALSHEGKTKRGQEGTKREQKRGQTHPCIRNPVIHSLL